MRVNREKTCGALKYAPEEDVMATVEEIVKCNQCGRGEYPINLQSGRDVSPNRIKIT